MSDDASLPVAEALKRACIETALAAYEDAKVRGLCHEGAWECAIEALRSLDAGALAAAAARNPPPPKKG
jgi:hypothetical protein